MKRKQSEEQETKQESTPIIIGVDEAGLGCLAGCLVAGAVVMLPAENSTHRIQGIKDSKTIKKESDRQALFNKIQQTTSSGLYYTTASSSERAIEEMNPLAANMNAMYRAVTSLIQDKIHRMPGYEKAGQIPSMPIHIQIDGSHQPSQFTSTLFLEQYPFVTTETIVKGDAKVYVISAASIVAKVTRDNLMNELDKLYPIYKFKKHKGYGTKEHCDLIAKYGPCPIHRKTYKKVKEFCT